jgi:hypothetical protein
MIVSTTSPFRGVAPVRFFAPASRRPVSMELPISFALAEWKRNRRELRVSDQMVF